MVALIGGIVAAVASVVGLAVNSSNQRSQAKANNIVNAYNLKKEDERYERQKADNIAMWNMQNEYNSPEQQMSRLRQAGLSPHLVYGKGADATAESIKPSSFSDVNSIAPKMQYDMGSQVKDVGRTLFDIYDLKAKQAQIDNVNQNTQLQAQQNILAQATTAKTLTDNARGTFDLKQANELKDSVIEQAKLNNQKTTADIMYTLDENQRKQLSNASDLKLASERIITEKIAHSRDNEQIKLLKEQLQSVQQEQNIKRYHEELSRMGIGPNDPWYFRGLMNLVHGNVAMPDVIKNGYDKIINGNLLPKQSNRGAGSTW